MAMKGVVMHSSCDEPSERAASKRTETHAERTSQHPAGASRW